MTKADTSLSTNRPPRPATALAKPAAAGRAQQRRSLSMHDGVPDWCDCCSCEAEPYWLEAAERLGIDVGVADGPEPD